MTFFPWEKLQDMNWLVATLQRRSVLTVWGLYGIQSCFQVCNLWKVYAIFSTGELEQSQEIQGGRPYEE